MSRLFKKILLVVSLFFCSVRVACMETAASTVPSEHPAGAAAAPLLETYVDAEGLVHVKAVQLKDIDEIPDYCVALLKILVHVPSNEDYKAILVVDGEPNLGKLLYLLMLRYGFICEDDLFGGWKIDFDPAGVLCLYYDDSTDCEKDNQVDPLEFVEIRKVLVGIIENVKNVWLDPFEYNLDPQERHLGTAIGVAMESTKSDKTRGEYVKKVPQVPFFDKFLLTDKACGFCCRILPEALAVCLYFESLIEFFGFKPGDVGIEVLGCYYCIWVAKDKIETFKAKLKLKVIQQQFHRMVGFEPYYYYKDFPLLNLDMRRFKKAYGR